MKRSEIKFGLNVIANGNSYKTFVCGFDDADGDVDVVVFFHNGKLMNHWYYLKDLKVIKNQKKRLYRLKRINVGYTYLLIHNRRLYCTESYDGLSLSKIRKSLLAILNSKFGDHTSESIFYDISKRDNGIIHVGCSCFKQCNVIRTWNHMAKDYKSIKLIKKVKGIYE